MEEEARGGPGRGLAGLWTPPHSCQSRVEAFRSLLWTRGASGLSGLLLWRGLGLGGVVTSEKAEEEQVSSGSR